MRDVRLPTLWCACVNLQILCEWGHLSTSFLSFLVFCHLSDKLDTPPVLTHRANRVMFFSTSYSEERGLLALFMWTYRKLRDFAQSLPNDQGYRKNKQQSINISIHFALPSLNPPHPAKNENTHDYTQKEKHPLSGIPWITAGLWRHPSLRISKWSNMERGSGGCRQVDKQPYWEDPIVSAGLRN